MEQKKKKSKRQIHFAIPKPRKSEYSLDFREFDDEFRPTLFKLYVAKTRDGDVADDLTQNTLIKFWRWASRRVERGLEFSWSRADGALSETCKMVYADYINESKKALDNVFIPDDLLEFDIPDNGLADPYRSLVGERTRDALRRFASLLRSDKDFFLDAVINGLSHRELARRYGKTEGSSGTDMCRYKKEFQEYMHCYDMFPEEEDVYAKISSRVH